MKRALVTGGSGYIGSTIAEALAADGLHVVVHANRNLTAAEAAVERICNTGGSGEAMALDLRDPGASTTLEEMATANPFQVFVHAIGGQRDVPFAAMSPEDWHDVVDLNLNTLFTALRPIIMPMIRSRFGRIVAISSLTAVIGNRGQTNYAAAKGGMLAMMKSLTREYASRGLTANVVAPGLIETPETRALDNFQALADLSPARRAGTPEEIAAVVAFLVSEKASYISGQMITVDGGTT
ncbi:MAG: SDR family NAD(P)-dependent oxidoreductase [Pseudomonadota bacterium]